MKRILLLCLTAVFTLASAEVWAQERTVSGKVTSQEDGSPLPGVNVVLKGTTIGTVTDADGVYTLSVPESGGTLVYTFIGLTTQEVVIGTRATVDLQMAADVQQLSEVVVSALGVDRNAREVVYANQTVSSENLLTTPNKNALEALRGKAAGVRLNTGSGSVGASTRIVLRGEGSLTGNNNALIVIDGIAIDNSSTTGGDGTSTAGYADHGNRFNDLNPDDIESVTILKGPSATSLYGSRGASGVVMITTKKGAKSKKGNVQVNLNSSYSVEQAYVMTKRQNRFGQGYDNAHFDSGENWSWGPAFDNVVRPWTNPVDTDGDGDYEWLSRPYSAAPDQLENFFNLGRTANNSVSISGANEGYTYYLSYSNTDQKGILDNTKYKRNTLTMSASGKLSKRLRSDFKVSYANVDQNTAQEGSRAFEGNNAYAMVLQSPVNIPFNEVRDYNSPFHNIDGYWGSYSSVNPYFILNEYGNQGNINNILGNASLTYNVMEGLDLIARVGTNVVSTEIETWVPKYTPAEQLVWTDDLGIVTRNTRHVSVGNYTYYHKLSKNVDLSFLANYTRSLSEDFKLDFSAGYNFFQNDIEATSGTTNGGLLVNGLYNFGNSKLNPIADLNRSSYRIFGVLGNARLGYKDAVFLELSARNDWSSTLPKNNNSFPYGAVGLSAVLSDLLQLDDNIVNFAKIRSSVGTSGKDAPLYVLNSAFVGNPEIFSGANPVRFPINGQPASTVGNLIGSPNLAPELTTTYEAGLDLGLFGERVNLEYTYYHSDHKEQIVQVSLPASSGFTSTYQNLGRMTNKGHEVSLRLQPIYGLVDGLKAELFVSYAKNISKVEKVSDEVDELVLATYAPGVSVVAKEGEPYGSFRAQKPLTNDAGQVVVDPNTGYPLYTDEEVIVGSFQPDFMSSFGANINYKGIGFNILFDLRQGGQFVSQTKFFNEFNGTSPNTTTYNREAFVYPNSVIENPDGTYSPNNIEITEQGYFTSYDPAGSTYLVDASYLKLREMGLTYDLPKSLVGKTPFSSARIALFAKNVKFWLADSNLWADPEATNGPGTTGNAIGIETTQTPPSRSLGVRLQLSF